jgi:hypothetical protein
LKGLFPEEEIKKTFDVLDQGKKGFITGEDI